MKKNEYEFKLIQQIVRKHYGALNVLCGVADKNRFDIIQAIKTLNQKDATQAITPEQIYALYQKCNNDIDEFIALIDKQFSAAKELRKVYDY